METKVRQRCRQLREELARSGRVDAKARYRVGAAVNAIKAEKKYGEGQVSLMAVALGFDEGTIYRYADVAVTWPSWSKVNHILKRRGASRLPISFSHLVCIARLKDAQGRDHLLNQVLDEGLNVRQLEARIARQSTDGQATDTATEEGEAGTPPPEPPWFRTVRETSETVRDGVNGLETELERLQGDHVQLVPDLAKDLAAILHRQEESVSRLTRLNARLRTILRSAAPASTGGVTAAAVAPGGGSIFAT